MKKKIQRGHFWNNSKRMVSSNSMHKWSLGYKDLASMPDDGKELGVFI